jgi:hypothetical protein
MVEFAMLHARLDYHTEHFFHTGKTEFHYHGNEITDCNQFRTIDKT